MRRLRSSLSRLCWLLTAAMAGGCSSELFTEIPGFASKGGYEVRIGGAARDDIWLIDVDKVQHWDGRDVVDVPVGRRKARAWGVLSTPGTLWFVDSDSVFALSPDGSVVEHSEHVPEGSRVLALATGDGSVWAVLDDGNILDVLSGVTVSVPGAVWISVIHDDDLWIGCGGGSLVAHWDGVSVKTWEYAVVDTLLAFTRNKHGEAMALRSPGFAQSKSPKWQVQPYTYLFALEDMLVERTVDAPPSDGDDELYAQPIGPLLWIREEIAIFTIRTHGRSDASVSSDDLVMNTWNGVRMSDDVVLMTIHDGCSPDPAPCAHDPTLVQLGDGTIATVLYTPVPSSNVHHVFVGALD